MGFMKDSEILAILTPIAEKACEEQSAFLVAIEILAGNKKLIEVIVQSDDGIKSGAVTAIARNINKEVEDIEFFQGEYHLDVGSPGIGRPISIIRELNPQINRLLKIEFKKELERQPLSAHLKSINGNILVLEEKKKKETVMYEVDFADTQNVTVEVEF